MIITQERKIRKIELLSRWPLLFKTAICLLFLPLFFCSAQNESNSDLPQNFISAADSINVSHYPPSMQEANELYENKCATCHGLKDTVEAPGVLPSYWESTVRDMAAKPNANISASDAKVITDFLIYDSSRRRRREVKKELDALSPEERSAEQAKIDAVTKSAR